MPTYRSTRKKTISTSYHCLLARCLAGRRRGIDLPWPLRCRHADLPRPTLPTLQDLAGRRLPRRRRRGVDLPGPSPTARRRGSTCLAPRPPSVDLPRPHAACPRLLHAAGRRLPAPRSGAGARGGGGRRSPSFSRRRMWILAVVFSWRRGVSSQRCWPAPGPRGGRGVGGRGDGGRLRVLAGLAMDAAPAADQAP
jgi:hypothetical protein